MADTVDMGSDGEEVAMAMKVLEQSVNGKDNSRKDGGESCDIQAVS